MCVYAKVWSKGRRLQTGGREFLAVLEPSNDAHVHRIDIILKMTSKRQSIKYIGLQACKCALCALIEHACVTHQLEMH
jgi:hypothetical protein